MDYNSFLCRRNSSFILCKKKKKNGTLQCQVYVEPGKFSNIVPFIWSIHIMCTRLLSIALIPHIILSYLCFIYILIGYTSFHGKCSSSLITNSMATFSNVSNAISAFPFLSSSSIELSGPFFGDTGEYKHV